MLTLRILIFAANLLLAIAPAAHPQDPGLPWLRAVPAEARFDEIISVRAEADVTVSDGTRYKTQSHYIDPQRAAFRMTYPDRTISRGVEGMYFWTFDGKRESEADLRGRDFVLGHQVHAQILFFANLHKGAPEYGEGEFIGEPVKYASVKDGDSTWTMFYTDAGPKGMRLLTGSGQTVQFEFGEFRPARGISLPAEVWIDDGSRRFKYVFTRIAFNEGSLLDFRAPERLLTDEQKLLRLHRIVMDDHYFGDAAGMKAINAAPFTVVSDGEVYTMTDAEADAGFDRIMSSRDYTVYDDVMRPIVRVSKDGSLGWVTVKVFAKGVRFDKDGKPAGPLEFTSAWTEFYEKIGGKWRMTGNVSNFAPGRK